MAEKTIELSGKSGLAAVFVVLAFVGFRFMTFDKNTDPKLREAVMAELRNELGGALQRKLNESDADRDYEELSELADADNITIYSIYVSEPVLSYSNNQKAILKVTFRLPGASKETRYYQFSHSLIGGWQYETTALSYQYYSNFF